MIGLDAAHYEMLAELHQQPSPPAESFLQAVFASAERQFRPDQEHYVPWNMHFLACLWRTLGTLLLAGARAVNTNPHYQHFSSPEPPEVSLGSEQSWPPLLSFNSSTLTNKLITTGYVNKQPDMRTRYGYCDLTNRPAEA
jgi:hypothetical protein